MSSLVDQFAAAIKRAVSSW